MQLFSMITVALLAVACGGDSSAPDPAGSPSAADATKSSKAEQGALSDRQKARRDAVRKAAESSRKIRDEQAEKRLEAMADRLPDDGWRAPSAVTDPAACKGAEPPKAVNPADLTPTPLPDNANPAMTDPSKATETAPDSFKVKFETTHGSFVVQAFRDWSPNGVDRFYNLVKIGYFDQARFFRNVEGFMVQFGISDYPAANAVWKDSRIKDEPVRMGNMRGVITFAKCNAPDCRSTQVFINHRNNIQLDGMGFAGFGRVIEGMDVVDKLYSCYGEGQPRGKGPRQDLVQQFGGAYLEAGYPNLDQIKRATIID